METHPTTREHIIQAAYRVLTEQGYDATTIKAIAREAEVAPGLLHYYFANKDELLVEVLRDISRRYTESMREVMASLPADQLGKAGFNDALQRTLRTPEAYRLRYELFALGLRNSTLLPAVTALLKGGRESIGKIVQAAGGEQAADPHLLAAILLACFDGLALQYLTDPDFDVKGAYEVLSHMVSVFLEHS
ncbi:MAG TPA: TetR/AcrR family transcriptional regulator [Ktedonobacteraceae bacterium]|nr:TetR/AcrR family transcriptional regulator [Ktedonobacteraceae bacterium]